MLKLMLEIICILYACRILVCRCHLFTQENGLIFTHFLISNVYLLQSESYFVLVAKILLKV